MYDVFSPIPNTTPYPILLSTPHPCMMYFLLFLILLHIPGPLNLPVTCVIPLNLPVYCFIPLNLPVFCVITLNLPVYCVYISLNLPVSCVISLNLLQPMYPTLYLKLLNIYTRYSLTYSISLYPCPTYP